MRLETLMQVILRSIKEHDRFSKAVSSNDLRQCQSLVNEFKTLCEDGFI